MRNRLASLDYLSWVAVHLFWLLLMVIVVVLDLLVQYAFCDNVLAGGPVQLPLSLHLEWFRSPLRSNVITSHQLVHFPEVLCSHMRFAMVALPRNSFRVRRLSSHHPIWATVSNHEAITRILITWRSSVSFYVLSTTVWIIRYDHQPNAGCGRAGCPLVLMSSCTSLLLSPPDISFCCFLQFFPLVSSHTISIALTSTASKHNSMPADNTS
jgi:hypothetical protein